MKSKFTGQKVEFKEEEKKQKKFMHQYSRFWDKIQQNVMAHVEKGTKK